ncbi:MAG: hypothetical protein RIG84_03665 [Roseovarius sp.]
MIDLSVVLTNTAAELEHLAMKASEIDEAVGDMLVSGGQGMAGLPMVLLQDVDLLRQTVDCLQILMNNIARQGACACGVSSSAVAEGIYLEAVRKRCLGR